MSDFLPAWLERAAAERGILACGFRAADKSVAVKSRHAEFPEAKIVEILRSLDDIVRALQQNRIGTRYFCWQFEKVRIHCALNDRGAVAALLVNRIGSTASVVDHLLADLLHAPE